MGLEAHWISLPRADYDDIVSCCQPGPSKDPARARKMRSFVVPERFRVAYSSAEDAKARTCNIFAAFVNEHHVWALIDFARLVRF